MFSFSIFFSSCSFSFFVPFVFSIWNSFSAVSLFMFISSSSCSISFFVIFVILSSISIVSSFFSMFSDSSIPFSSFLLFM